MKLVSVIMSVHNTKEQFLRTAIESVIGQTYQNLEIIIVDDDSDKWCREVLNTYNDNRIKLILNERNMGLAASLNKAIACAQGCYVARMDSDDISYPNRIAEQVAYMEQHPEVDVLACVAALLQNDKRTGLSGMYRKLGVEEARIKMSFANIPFVHPTVMFRREFLQRYDLWYDKTLYKAQDYNMWVRCLEHGRIQVLQKVLLDYRIHEGQLSGESESQKAYVNRTKEYCLKRLLPNCTDEEKDVYFHLRDQCLYGEAESNRKLMELLVSENRQRHVYQKRKYEAQVYFFWLRKALWRENARHRSEMLKGFGMKWLVFKAAVSELLPYIRQKLYERRYTRAWKESEKQSMKEQRYE